MKKVIDGKLYNTETAELLGSWDNGCSYTDFGYCSEALYKTRKGAFFLHGEGGPLSKYGRCAGNVTHGSARIVPLTPKEAFRWAEAHMPGEEVEALFPEFVEEA